jgi:MFS family permease
VRPPPTTAARDAWPSYLTIAAVGYAVYGVGAITPNLRSQLGLSDGQVGLHSSAMAIGFILAGVIAAPLDRRFGETRIRGAAMVGLAIALATLAAAPALGMTLFGAGLVGLGSGTLLGYSNAILALPGGRLARLRVARANVWAMVSAFVCPVALAGAAIAGLPWGVGLAPAILLLLGIGADLRGGPRLGRPTEGPVTNRLPRAYWLAWAFLVAAIAVEFSIVFWGATLVERRTGVDTPVAILLGGLFLGGMFVGRSAQSLGLGTGGGLRRPAAIGVGLAAVGAAIAWFSTTPALSGTGLFIAGLGVAGLYPLGVAAALATAPDQLTVAGTRLTLASGVAILAAPVTLGVAADITGVPVAWGLVVVLAVVALGLAAGLPASVTAEVGATASIG